MAVHHYGNATTIPQVERALTEEDFKYKPKETKHYTLDQKHIDDNFKMFKPVDRILDSMGYFITIEGVDCSGKGTLIEGLKKRIVSDVVYTSANAGTELNNDLYNALKESSKSGDVDVYTDMMVRMAMHNELLNKVVTPNRILGRHVISDRFVDSTFAYQTFSLENPNEAIAQRQHFLSQLYYQMMDKHTAPNFTVILSVSPYTVIERLKERGGVDYMEEKGEYLFHHVTRTYENIAETAEDNIMLPRNYIIVDANRPAEEVLEEVLAWFRGCLPRLIIE